MAQQNMEAKDVRLKSLDALRGFDMLFIMGFASWVVAVCNLFPSCGLTEGLAEQMEHVKWSGLTHHDTIFPLFLFIAGISFPFSFSKQLSNGKSQRQIISKIISRGLILVLLGFVYNGFFRFDFPNMRYASVLARIGLGWMFAALLFVFCKTKVRIVISAVILIGYWLLMWLLPSGNDPFSFENNLVGTIDRVLLPGRLHNGSFDPEGLFSTLPAIVTAMLGMFTGQFIRLPKEQFSGNKKTIYMLAAAAALLIIGLIWNHWFPVNKSLWTSSFVCVVGSYSLFMFAIFYYIIDVKDKYRWSFFFRVIGLNSITIYLAQRIIGFQRISDFFLAGIADKCPEAIGNLINETGYVAVCWLFLYFLYKQKIFLKI
jgi:predicted acyltransferase